MAHSHRQRPEHARARDVGLAFHRPRRVTTLAATAGLLVAGATIAVAGTPPAGPGNIEIFNKRSMVALEGYVAQAGQTATVKVIRDGSPIAVGEGTIDSTGFLEFNHPGGECWIGVTPNLQPGDEVKVSFSGADFTDSAITMSPTVTEVVGSGFTSSGEVVEGDPVTRVRGTGTVTINGTYDPADPWFSVERFVIETVNPENKNDKTPPGEDPGLVDARAMGISLVTDEEHPNGDPPNWLAEATLDPAAGTWSGTYTLHTEADYDRTLEGDHVAASWMAGEEPALGLTQNEFEEIPGPGMGGCPLGPDGQAPNPLTTASLSSTSGSTSIDVSWTAPAQPADAPAVSGYRISAVGGTHPEQETAERTGGLTASLDNLEAGATYDVYAETYNGRWSAPQPIGQIVIGSGTGSTPPAEEPPPTEEPGELTQAPALVTGLTATSESLDSVQVAWTASPAAEQVTGYTVTADDGNPETVEPAAVSTTTPSAVLSGLAADTQYTVEVTATNTIGTGEAASTVVTTLSGVAPTPFTVTRTLAGDTQVQVEWTASAPGNAASPLTGYQIRATDPAGATATADVGPTATQGAVTGLVNDTLYAVSVVALGGGGETAATAASSAVSMSVTPEPSASFSRVEYKPRSTTQFEWRISGSASPSLVGQTVTTTTSTGGAICQAAIQADGAFSCSARNGTRTATDNGVIGTATDGFVFTGTVTRLR